MRYTTMQDHIDRRILSVRPCATHTMMSKRGETCVYFDDGSWACSSGHVSPDFDSLPTLRTPDRDPVAWVRANAEKIVRSLAIIKCPGHEDDSFAQAKWGEDGHLWGSGPSGRILALCLPRGNVHV